MSANLKATLILDSILTLIECETINHTCFGQLQHSHFPYIKLPMED